MARRLTVRLVKDPRPACGDYTLDAFVVALRDTPAGLDFEFQLGKGLGIFRAAPTGRLEGLRLLHVDGAAYTLLEPELVEVPWRVDVARLEWTGELGRLGNGDALVAVRIEVRASPASYRCELVTRAPSGAERTTVLAWRETPAELRALPPLERADALDTMLRRMARDEVLDIAGIGMVHEAAGELMDRDFIDGAQYAAVTALRDAAVRGEVEWLRRALGHGFAGVPPPVVAAPFHAGPVLRGHRAYVGAAAFSHCGTKLLTGDERGRLVLYARAGADAPFEQRLAVETGSGRRTSPHVRAVAWAANDRVLAVHEGAAVRLRDAMSLAVRAERSPIGTGPLGWGPGDAWLAVLGHSGVHVLDPASLADREFFEIRGEIAGATVTAFAVDGSSPRVAVADDGGVEETAMAMPIRRGTPGAVVCAIDGSAPRAPLLRGEYVFALAFDPWRGALLAATLGGALVWWTGGEAPSRVRQPFNDSSVRALAVTERWLVLAPDRPPGDATLELYDAEHFVHVASVPVPSGLSPGWIAVSPDGRALATPELPAAGDFGVRLWHLT